MPRDGTCIGRWILSHWTTGEVPPQGPQRWSTQLPLPSSQPPRGNLVTFLSLLSWFRAEILIAGATHLFMQILHLLSSSAEPQPLFAIFAPRIRCPLCAGIYPRCSHVAAVGVHSGPVGATDLCPRPHTIPHTGPKEITSRMHAC